MRDTLRSRWSWVVSFLAVTGGGCAEAEPRLVQVPEPAGLTVVDGGLAPRDVAGAPDTALGGGDVEPDETGPDEDTPATPDAVSDDASPAEDATVPEDTGAVEDTSPAEDTGPDAGGGLACTSDADCVTVEVCAVARCVAGSCEVAPRADGTACDDGDVCTEDDVCTAGRCRGLTPRVCDDGNACTADACQTGQGCVSTAIVCNDQNACTRDSCDPATGCFATSTCDDGDVCTLDLCGPNGACTATSIPGCDATDPCAGQLGGAACDDGNAETSGDMCISGRCSGYRTERIGGSGVRWGDFRYQGLVVTEVDHGPAGWAGVFWSAGTSGGRTVLAWSLADLSDPESIGYYSATLDEPSRDWPNHYAGLSDGYVVRGGAEVGVFDGQAGQWSWSSTWKDAVDAANLDLVTTLVSVRDTNATGAGTTRRLWLGYRDNGDGGVLNCTTGADGRVGCRRQTLTTPRGDNGDGVYPVALAAIPRCQASGCSGAWMSLGADYQASNSGTERWAPETYLNGLGDGATWSGGWSSPDTTASETAAVAAWGSVTAPRVLLVGSRGLLVFGAGAGGVVTWTRLTGVSGLESRSFTGATVVGDTVLVSATRVSGAEVVYELWALPISGDGGAAGSWRIHELARASSVQAAGLYDVDGRSGGEVLAVGAIRRVDGSAWLDGLILRRSGD
jgi:hypothetical protein